MLEFLEILSTAAVLTAILASTVRNHLQSDESPIDEAKRLFLVGEIDEPDLERRLGEAANDRHEQIRRVVEDINGVGPKTSKVIAREFDSLDELRRSERVQLESVYGVGDETAGAVLSRVRDE